MSARYTSALGRGNIQIMSKPSVGRAHAHQSTTCMLVTEPCTSTCVSISTRCETKDQRKQNGRRDVEGHEPTVKLILPPSTKNRIGSAFPAAAPSPDSVHNGRHSTAVCSASSGHAAPVILQVSKAAHAMHRTHRGSRARWGATE